MLFAAALAWARAARHEWFLPGPTWLGPRLLPEVRTLSKREGGPGAAKEQRHKNIPSIFSSRGPKSPEHRAKISASIRAKWRQPVRSCAPKGGALLMTEEGESPPDEKPTNVA